jgi:hypothetical protein
MVGQVKDVCSSQEPMMLSVVKLILVTLSSNITGST